MKSITERGNFEKAIEQDKAVVMFSADWCPDCRVIEPALPEIEEQYNGFQFFHADRDELIEVCQEYGIFGIPSFLAFQNGKEVNRFVSKSRKSPEEVKQFLDEALAKMN
ncbi:thioredoxin family protein [Alteribacillus sp. HJP-4]|uniref:thioredoxin family protein n=1 Tax=Alteribacillus sp. HJP-4 TaxID=2775394 RepID=UPI0035CD2003